jgi:hypothetical protein
MTPLHVTAQLLPGGHLVLVLLEIGAAPDGPHWVLSAADARELGWYLIDAANGQTVPGGLDVQDRHMLTPRDIPPAGNAE